MSYELYMSEDGTVRMTFASNIDPSDMRAFMNDFNVFLEAATEKNPVHSIAHISAIDNISAEARATFIQLNQDNRFGYMACIGNNRRFRVLAKFMENAAGRNNIQMFDIEEDAINWLNNKNTEVIPRVRVESLS